LATVAPGTALVDEAPDWASMSAVEMAEWMAHVMAGWYAVEEAAPSRG